VGDTPSCLLPLNRQPSLFFSGMFKGRLSPLPQRMPDRLPSSADLSCPHRSSVSHSSDNHGSPSSSFFLFFKKSARFRPVFCARGQHHSCSPTSESTPMSSPPFSFFPCLFLHSRVRSLPLLFFIPVSAPFLAEHEASPPPSCKHPSSSTLLIVTFP